MLAIVQVPSHLRHRQNVVAVMTLASVPKILLLQNGHMTGRITFSWNGDSDIVSFSLLHRTRRRRITGQQV
jgi:hypothetical protein